MTDQTERPNVLLICTDHWGGLLTRAAGHPVVMTPTLSQLSRYGTTFSNAYTACPSCIPARRTLMTGMTARSHGDRIFKELEEMPAAPTLAQCFGDAGYQTAAVGKLHVYPQRDRIGFDEVISNEEGRHHLGAGADDWELHIAEHGYPGQEFAAGGCTNDYNVTPWHMPDHLHPTNWAASQMCRMMHRRDPRKPGFWYLSFVGPHPPVWPQQRYLDMYRDVDIDAPVVGDWSRTREQLPAALRHYYDGGMAMIDAPAHEIELARRAFYATLTHIDHQIRVVLGYLRENGLLGNTIVAFTADHGDMLGDHGLWAKTRMYEMSAKVPLVLKGVEGDDRVANDTSDDRLAELGDIMPTLLELAGLPVPETVDGRSLCGSARRPYLYGEHWEDERATRMIRDQQYKLIYYPVDNVRQLFDIDADPREQHDLAADPAQAERLAALTELLVSELYGSDLEWVQDGQLVGCTAEEPGPLPHRLAGQRGWRYL
jgi:arylsulfatase A-like enzyme